MILAIVALWSFAEAILWFIVADVPISAVAVRHGPRAGLVAAGVATLAAVVGGLMTYGWARHDPAGATAAITALPAIDPALIARVATDFADGGLPAMLAGSFSGTPYKLYALAAGSQQAPLASFLLASVIARLPRFALVALVAGGIGEWLGRRWTMRARLGLLAGLWVLFYALYLAAMA